MIFVDPAQGSADVAPLLTKAGLEVIVAPLTYADIEFSGRGIKGAGVLVGVELKRLSELTADWDRFAGVQLPKMTKKYDHRWLVYEGDWYQDKRGSLLKRVGARRFRVLHGQPSASALRKKLLTLELCAGMHRHQTKDRADTVRFLVDLYRFWTDDDLDQHSSHIVVNYQPHTLLSFTDEEKAIAAWPHISTKRCKTVARFFKGRIDEAARASVKTWAAIEIPDDKGTVRRIGEKHATDIVRFLRGEGYEKTKKR